MQNRISEKTWVPIGFMTSSIIALIGGVFWLSSMYALTNKNSEEIYSLKSSIKSVEIEQSLTKEKLISEMNTRLTVIESKMDLIFELLRDLKSKKELK